MSKPAKKRSLRHQLNNRGADTSRQRPEDIAEFDQRVRRGLEGENSKAWGKMAARGSIKARVTGDLLGRRDERRRQG